MDLGNAINIALTLGGAGVGAYLGVRLSVTRLEGRMASAESEIKRLRDWHEAHGAALPIRMTALEANLQGMRDWKHEVVDPYLPRAVDEHERRLNVLEKQ